ncbi:protein SMG9-like isoform X1 [Ostrinia furnacalis]|uniref:protein SMG9-like isoform X1 n=1 Tax=Ostrinia furnacalis TaxID=93504 RepID=UPI00103898DE|nr:protein SMG9-like isoform X1 [Ostrinia furnacalis]
MSDKKKKVFTPKEYTTTRRPVILKSDRDPPKEQPKEKPEREKQPTIILKTREQSTSKEERPLSPKSIKSPTSENDGIQPSKIAHNENKEKKDSKPSPPLKFMTEPVKLLDENLEFNNAALEFLHDSSTNYLVVGIIGNQGVGKSMIMNLIALNTHTEELCNHILHSHELADSTFVLNDVSAVSNQLEALNFSGMQDKKTSAVDFKFKMQDIEQIERGTHCTKGIDMYITNDRVILLDCQALWSPSLIEESNTNPITARSTNVMTVDCLQIASYLMAICHVLIGVQDWFTDYNFIRYIQAAEMLKPSLSSSSGSQEPNEPAHGADSQPHLLLLHNRCQLEDFTPEAVTAMQDVYRKAFQKSNLQLQSGMYLYNDCNRNGPGSSMGAFNERCGAPLNLFLLPEIQPCGNQETYRGHPPFEQLAKRLRWMVMGVHRHQITNVPNLSEKGWFHFCTKAWETIRKCTFFMEYERFLP